MDPIGRRDLIALVLQAMLMALFPWLRAGRGAVAAARITEQLLADPLSYDAWHSYATWHIANGYRLRWGEPNPLVDR